MKVPMTKPPLYREELDQGMCYLCGSGQTTDHEHSLDEPLFIHAMCHPQANMTVSYVAGVVTIVCAKCGKLVVKICVASKNGVAS